MKVIELFAGVGSQTQALKNIGVEHEIIGISEIDKFAIKTYEQLHGETHNFGCISKIESLPKVDLWTYSFPCTDISTAGKNAGIKKGTRSGLLLEVERLLATSEKPKYLLMENVKNLVSKKHKPDFDIWCKKLEELGYENHWEVMNAKDYGVPQNRERVFMVSIFKEHGFEYKFPEKVKLETRLKDVLEEQVEEKYYLSETAIANFRNHRERHIEKGTGFIWKPKDLESNTVANCLRASAKISATDNTLKIKQIGNISKTAWNNPQVGRIYEVDGISPALNTCGGGQREPKVLVEPIIGASRGRYVDDVKENGSITEQRLEINRDRISNTLTYTQKDNLVIEDFRIRKLTPRECWRLMGWRDEQIDKIQGISNNQLYKQAGNGIVVSVLEGIFKNLFKERGIL